MKYIYNSPLQEAAQTGERDRLGQQLAEAGILDADSAAVESISSNAADLRLEGQIRYGADISGMLADELDELADSSLGELPLYRRGSGWQNAGYYEIASADVEPLHANQRDVWSWTLNLTAAGKRSSHFRAVETNPSGLEHEFGTGLVATVAAPTTARKVRWLHPDDMSSELAEPIETRPASNVDADIYDLSDASWYDPPPFDADPPTLVYEVPYADDARAGVRVYDTRGHSGKFADAGYRQWQTVHSTDHDPEGNLVMSNGLLRLRIDEDDGTLTAEEWDDSAESWADVGLTQPSTVDLFDADLETVAMVRDVAQLTFDVDGSLFSLDATVARGADEVLFHRPDNQPGPIPSDLENWLEPIASTSIVDPQAEKTLESRQAVRR